MTESGGEGRAIAADGRRQRAEGKGQRSAVRTARSRQVRVASGLVLAGLLLLSCGKQPGLRQASGPVVGTVNGDRMTVKLVDAFGQMLEEEMARRGVEVEFGVTTENLPLVLEEMVTVELMAQEAVRRGYAKEPAVAAALAWQERRALAEELQERLFAPLEASQQDIMQYFTQHRDEFGYGLKVQWMVLADTLLGRALLDSVNAGVDFAGLARRHSLDTTITPATFLRRSVGMALNWSLADEEAVFALRPGQVSGIINLPKGCQLVKVLERKRIVDVVTYNDAVHEYISGALTLDKQRAARDSLISELRKAAKVELTPEAYFRQAD